MTLRLLLIKVWQGERFEIGEIISFLELNNVAAIAEILRDLAERRISVNAAERLLEEAKQCVC
jgi:DNA-binding transcriptional MerR regulator